MAMRSSSCCICPQMQEGFLAILIIIIVVLFVCEAGSISDADILLAFWKDISANSTSPPDSSKGDPCSWKGVRCMNNRVHSVDFSDLELEGTISPSIVSLSSLSYLNLSDNFITGDIPEGLHLLSKLQVIDFSSNILSGSIPTICSSDPSNPSKLKQLILHDNMLSGFLDSSLLHCRNLRILHLAYNQLDDSQMLSSFSSQLFELQYLSLSGNFIRSSIPAAIKVWQNATQICLDDCGLTGALPAEIGLLTKLEVLSVGNNQMTGELLNVLMNCKNLKVLSLSRNQFTGPIPSFFGNLAKLEAFQLDGNMLTGSIPESIFSLSHLLDLKLSNNSLDGSIPKAIGLGTSLLSLDLSLNQIAGSIPDEIIGCQFLSWIDLSHNQLSGIIPQAIANLTNLNYLNLSHNHLTGEIPPSMADLPKLQMVDVSFNLLVGVVPDTKAFRESGRSSFANNTHLCGWNTNQSTEACLSSINRGYFFDNFSLRVAIIVVSLASLGIIIVAWQCIIRRSPLGSGVATYNVSRKVFSVRDLFDATEGFSQSNFLGQGTHYQVYKGNFAGKKIAVKCLMQDFMEEFSQTFIVDWMTISRAKSPNLIDVIGWCSSTELLAAVTTFMPNGTLEHQLHGTRGSGSMPWERRLHIAEGIASGLAYLHRKWQTKPQLRCELRPSNILLDDQFQAHLSNIQIDKTNYTFVEGQGPLMDGYTAPEDHFSFLKINTVGQFLMHRWGGGCHPIEGKRVSIA